MTDFAFVRSEVAGRIPMVAAGVPAAGLRGGWRDCCIVNAPERSGLGALVVLRALVSLLAFVVRRCCSFLSSSGGEADFIWLALVVVKAAGATKG